MLAAHPDCQLHHFGVRVVVEAVLFVCCQEGVEFEQEGTDVGVLVALWEWLSVGRSDAFDFQVAAQQLFQLVQSVLA